MKIPSNKMLGSDPLEEKWKSWKKNEDPTVFSEMVNDLSSTISSGVTTFAGGRQAPSVSSRARILASKAIKKWDPKGGSKLKNYVFQQLQPLTRFSARAAQPMPMPEKAESELRRVYQAQEELSSRVGREPTVQELCDHLQLSPIRLERIRKRYEKPRMTEGQLRDAEFMGATTPPNWQDIWKDYVYLDLEPLDKKIFEWRTGYGGSPILNNMLISKRLKISPSAVSQRASKIDTFLAKGLEYRSKEKE